MPRWYLLPALLIASLVQEAWATTLLGREPSRLQARGTNVLDDKFFIPAIATIGAFVLVSLVCLYFLGCCCNSRKMDEFNSAAPPARQALRNSASYQPPAANMHSADASDKYSNVSPSRTTPQATPPAQPAARLDAQPWSSNGNQWSSMPPLPTSHGFQSPAHTAVPPSVMSVHHLNPTAASYHHRESDRSQLPRPHIPPDARRMSSMSSATSSTQIGEQPYVYSPHQGNTLSYVSSTNPSVVGAPAWDGSAVPRMPTNDNVAMAAAQPDKQGYSHRVPPTPSGPPAYMDEGRTGDMSKS